jgi:hypothetical protein
MHPSSFNTHVHGNCSMYGHMRARAQKKKHSTLSPRSDPQDMESHHASLDTALFPSILLPSHTHSRTAHGARAGGDTRILLDHDHSRELRYWPSNPSARRDCFHHG